MDGYLDRRPGSGTYLNPSARQNAGLFGMIIPGHGTTEIFERIGRESTIFFAVGSASAPEVYSFMVARFIGGLGVGISTVAAPLYISEKGRSLYASRGLWFLLLHDDAAVGLG